VFLLAMAGITAFEALVGKPLDAVVGSGHGSGTTIGSIVGGSGGGADAGIPAPQERLHSSPGHFGPGENGFPGPCPRG
jgi:hypothetical protein